MMSRTKVQQYVVLAVIAVAAVLAVSWCMGMRNWGDLSSRGQFVVEVLLLPAAILGFFRAMEELRKAQEVPVLDLHWMTDGDTLPKAEATVEKPKQGEALLPLKFAVLNTGRAVCVWYMLEFIVPVGLARTGHPDTIRVRRIVGDDDNWNKALISAGEEGSLFTFRSNGRIAVYPDYPLILGELRGHLFAQREYSAAFEVTYKIASDKGKFKEGVLRIRVA